MKTIKPNIVYLWVVIAASGCLDLALLDDMIPPDAGSDAGEDEEGGSDSETPDAGGTDEPVDTDGPPNTDPLDGDPPVVAPAVCDSAESIVGNACRALGPISASLRMVTDEPAQVTVHAEEPALGTAVSEPWGTDHQIVVIDLPADREIVVALSVADVNGNSAETVVPVIGAGGPAVAISEILADPLGPEPAQEFVEVVNYGATPVDLAGWMLDDNGDADGDLIAGPAVLAPFAVAILVAGGFDPQEGQDPAPDGQSLILRLDSSIGTSGLKNSEAETVELYDAEGALVSRYRAQAGKPIEGRSVVRRWAELPDGAGLAFELEPQGSASPGVVGFIDFSAGQALPRSRR